MRDGSGDWCVEFPGLVTLNFVLTRIFNNARTVTVSNFGIWIVFVGSFSLLAHNVAFWVRILVVLKWWESRRICFLLMLTWMFQASSNNNNNIWQLLHSSAHKINPDTRYLKMWKKSRHVTNALQNVFAQNTPLDLPILVMLTFNESQLGFEFEYLILSNSESSSLQPEHFYTSVSLKKNG